MMPIHLSLYILVAALMTLLVIAFVCVVLVFRCKKKKANRDPHWIRSMSIEHLRFSPRDLEEQKVRTSTPLYANLSSFQEFIAQSQRGSPIPQAVKPSEIHLNPGQLSESNTARYTFRTFTPDVKQPKIIYWETCL